MIIYTQNCREYRYCLWFQGVFFPVTAGIFFSPWLAVVGETLFVADFYHWISGGILHDGFEAVMKNAIAGFYMIVIGWVVAITGYFSK